MLINLYIMPTFIKTGFWEQTCRTCKGYNGWLNLDNFLAGNGTSGTSGQSGPQGIQGIQGVTGPAGTSGTSGLSGDKYQTTSTTSFTLGSGGTITIGTGLAYTTAQDILISYNISNHQVSMITSYNPTTGVLVFGAPSEITGSGTYASWSVNLNGAAGGDGTSGTSGLAGTSGISGPQGIQGVQGISGTSGVNGSAGTSGTSGTSAPPTKSYGLFAQTADSTPVTATTVETTIIGAGVGGLTFPANGFQIGDSFACVLEGIITCLGSATLHVRVRTLAGVLLADTGIISMEATTNKSWLINLYFTIRTLGGAGVASISSGGLFSYIKNSGTNFEGYVLSTLNNTTFNTTIDNTLIITAQWNTTNAGNSIVTKNFTLTKIY